MKFVWCWFCWKLTSHWWPFDTNGPIGFKVYLWFLPWAGDYIYWDFDPDSPAGHARPREG